MNTATARPHIVCLCGSTRFYDEFRRANLRLTLAGYIVLSIGCDTKSDGDLADAAAFGADPAAFKVNLDELHKRKIDLADEVLVVSDTSGYFGDSTAGEIRYAIEHGKQVRFAVPLSESRALNAGLLVPAEADEADTRQAETTTPGTADGLLDWAARLISRASAPAASPARWRTEQRDWLSAYRATPPAGMPADGPQPDGAATDSTGSTTETPNPAAAGTGPREGRPSPFELWAQADGDAAEYNRLMREHWDIVRRDPAPEDRT